MKFDRHGRGVRRLPASAPCSSSAAPLPSSNWSVGKGVSAGHPRQSSCSDEIQPPANLRDSVDFSPLRLLLPAIFASVLWMDGGSPLQRRVHRESLRGRTITAQLAYETRARREGKEFDNPVKFDFVINIGGDDKVNGTVTRHVVGPRGPQSETRSFSAAIGKPRQAGEGHSLMLLSGNTSYDAAHLRGWRREDAPLRLAAAVHAPSGRP